MQFEVKVRKIIDNDKPLKAVCSVTMDECLLFTMSE